MKKYLIIFATAAMAVAGGLKILSGTMGGHSYYMSDYMDIEDAEEKWGIETFDEKRFREGKISSRAAMAVDLIKRNLFVGKEMKETRELLGDPDSYFFSDTILAYQIMLFPGEGNESWHLIFVPDRDLQKVKEVRFHKKCCYKSPL